MQMKIKVLEKEFSVCKVHFFAPDVCRGEFWFAAQTDEEMSLVCQSEFAPKNAFERSDGWRAMRIEGVLDFSLVGILAKISDVLAQAQVGIFAVSTYNTDYILVKGADLMRAADALRAAGYEL